MAINLKAKMSMDSCGFVAGANNAKVAMSSLGSHMSGMKAMLTAGIFAGAIAGLKALGMNALKTGDDIMNWSARMGVSAKAVQQLKLEADEAGIAFKAILNSFGLLARMSQEALGGNKKYAQSFEALGLSMQDLEGMRQEEMFERLSKTQNWIALHFLLLFCSSRGLPTLPSQPSQSVAAATATLRMSAYGSL